MFLSFLRWAGNVQHLLWYFKGRSESACHTHMVKKKTLASPCLLTTSLFEPPYLTISSPSTAKQETLASAMSAFMQPSSSKAWLWSSCNFISWLGNPCLQWSMLLASSSPSLDHHQVPSSWSCTSVCSPPVPASLAYCKFKHKRRTEYAIKTCCVGFSVMVWFLYAVQIVKAKFGLRKPIENSPCGEKGREKHAFPAELAPVPIICLWQVVKIKFCNMDIRPIWNLSPKAFT